MYFRLILIENEANRKVCLVFAYAGTCKRKAHENGNGKSFPTLGIQHFAGVFLLQFFCQIHITHTVHIRYAITDQLIYLGMIKELQCRIQ